MAGGFPIAWILEKKNVYRSSFASSPHAIPSHQPPPTGLDTPRRVSNGCRQEVWNILDTAMNTLLRATLASSECASLRHARGAGRVFTFTTFRGKTRPLLKNHEPVFPDTVRCPTPLRKLCGILTLLQDQGRKGRALPHATQPPCDDHYRPGQSRGQTLPT